MPNAIAKTPHFMALDGLRGVAAIIVVLFHRRFWIEGYDLSHGALAVDFFFLLSGFVISCAYERKIRSDLLPTWTFAKLRLVRLYPLIVFGAMLGALPFIIEGITKGWLGLIVRVVLSIPFAMAALPQPFFDEPFRINGPSWSLFLEIVANVAFVMFARVNNRLLIIIASGLGAALCTAVWLHGDIYFGWTWQTMPLGLLRVGFPFTAGMILQRLHRAGRLTMVAVPVWVTAPLLMAILLAPRLPSPIMDVVFVLSGTFVAFPLMLAGAANDHPTAFWWRICAFSAELSYPLYISHVPVLSLLDFIPDFDRLPVALRFPLAITICIVVAIALSRFYDEPARRRLKMMLRSEETTVRLRENSAASATMVARKNT